MAPIGSEVSLRKTSSGRIRATRGEQSRRIGGPDHGMFDRRSPQKAWPVRWAQTAPRASSLSERRFVAFGADVQIPSGGPCVSVMQAANLRNRDDAAATRWLDLSRNGCISAE